MRESGLPPLLPHDHGERALLAGAKGVVRAIYPERWRVDLETDEGSLLTEVLVIGPYFPQLHEDGLEPSHVGYLYVHGGPDAVCWPMPHRRLLGPADRPSTAPAGDQPERRYFHLHHYIFRSGDVTMRITNDNRFVIETEEGDYVLLDTQRRTAEVHFPTVFVGTDDATRIEYQRDTEVRVVMPRILLGDLALPDTDGLSYIKDTILHLVSPLIKLTADTIVLDPTSIRLGHENATERVMLGDLWKAFYNAFVTLFNAHTHSNVQTGISVSGPPTTPTTAMDDSMLSDVTHVSKTGL
jgi:hypothetical protein